MKTLKGYLFWGGFIILSVIEGWIHNSQGDKILAHIAFLGALIAIAVVDIKLTLQGYDGE